MPFQTIQNGESGLNVRNALNGMLQELYNSIATPVKLPGENVNFTQVFPANTKLQQVSMVALEGTPTIRVGTTPNGHDLVEDTVVDQSNDYVLQYYCKQATTVYFTFVQGPGTISARVDVINNYY